MRQKSTTGRFFFWFLERLGVRIQLADFDLDITAADLEADLGFGR